ncbi:MAG TPA: tRNA lysidine(34) synthetase TilS [Candidatus Omnitrophota bacterium]|nr:tRNA lysidine(34) synthetase TilS [Candidatus Omnitrophota bacterium]
MKRNPMSDFLADFQNHIANQSFFRGKEKILIACSGGPDSIALLRLMVALAPKHRWQLGVLHYNHRLRKSAGNDLRFVRFLSKELGLAFHSGSGNVRREAVKTGTSIEEAARKMRYDFFLGTAKKLGIQKIALGHTLDDQAETVLMRILQGTGLRGLQGIREVHRMEGIDLIRPLLKFSKKEILDFCRTEKIEFRKDESNRSVRFFRNRIRLKLLPVLKRDFNPRITEALARIPAIASREIALLDRLEAQAWKAAVKKVGTKRIELKREVFFQMESPLQFRIIERALKKIHPQSGLSYEAWERIWRGFSRARNRWSLPKDIDFALTPKTVTVFKKSSP